MPTTKHDTFFRQHPVFTGEDLAEHLSTSDRAGARTQESLVAYHAKTGRLVLVRRGLFAVIPPEAHNNTYPIDPYLIASQAYAGLGSVPTTRRWSYTDEPTRYGSISPTWRPARWSR